MVELRKRMQSRLSRFLEGLRIKDICVIVLIWYADLFIPIQIHIFVFTRIPLEFPEIFIFVFLLKFLVT